MDSCIKHFLTKIMKKYNFSPGPARLDPSVISKSKKGISNYENTGLSILEIGHRSKEFEILINSLQENMISIFNIPSDYLILGSVTEYGRRTEGDVGVLSRTKKQIANASVNIRLVDVKTGQIIYSEEGSAEVSSEVGTVIGIGSQAGYDSSLDGKAISGAITKLVSALRPLSLSFSLRYPFLKSCTARVT